MNDREILCRLEAASPRQLAELLRRPTEDEARVYRTYFGAARYDALRRKTLATRGGTRAPKRGNVVILHGIMGGELTVRNDSKDQHIWLNILRMAMGGVGWLRMEEGKSVFDVRATGILKKWYVEQIVELSHDWKVETYWYDWRRDLDETADDLRAKIDGWFGDQAAVNLVAHSMGGLVSRSYIARHKARWAKGGKLVMLGTPNHGSFAIPQVITGVIDTVRKLDLVDFKHSLAEITGILGPLPGSLQMLPSPLVMPAMARLYQSSTWGGRVPQSLLNRALQHHEKLAEIVDGSRMHYIAGCNRRTYDDIRDWQRLDALDGYSTSMNGDGTVPHRLGFLEDDGRRIPTWFVQEDHGALPNNAQVIIATQRLLLDDKCDLPTKPEAARSVAADRSMARTAERDRLSQRDADEERLATLMERFQSRSRSVEPSESEAVIEATPISGDEMEAVDILLRGLLSESAGAPEAPRVAHTAAKVKKPAVSEQPRVEIALIHGDLAAPPTPRQGVPPVDAISVGHYIGVPPQYAELALDRAISGVKEGGPEKDLLLTALYRRGGIAAQLGQLTMIPDPRHPERIAVLAGMGAPGSFCVPQLTVAVRELIWTLGRLGRKHLATVLIGAGVGNLDQSSAVRTWLRGIRRALYEAESAEIPRLVRISFIENSPANLVRLHLALQEECTAAGQSSEPLWVNYLPPTERVLAEAASEAESKAGDHARKTIKLELSGKSRPKAIDAPPVHFTVGLVKDTYEFSVLSSEASIPQRNITVDPELIDEINNQLPIAASYLRQRDLGHLLGQVLVPREIRDETIKSSAPTVLALDATTARIHFEMMALSPSAGLDEFEPEQIMGLAAKLTRQLRTTFAPIPEPPMMAGRPLRVLVIADPCAESPLAGAQEEGEAVARLFEEFRAMRPDTVDEPVRLFGPSEATRVAVLDHLVNQRFDLVHFAGHCFYKKDEPARSGWLFSRNQVLSAFELSRIDRVPRFVFSNACESGITPDRANHRHASFAPSFAEAFFARGVSNFICTAWPVDDAAALAFATRVYRGLLGQSGGAPEPLHEAMWAARLEIAKMAGGGLTTWGAYQHYGDPHFRIIPPGGSERDSK